MRYVGDSRCPVFVKCLAANVKDLSLRGIPSFGALLVVSVPGYGVSQYEAWFALGCGSAFL